MLRLHRSDRTVLPRRSRRERLAVELLEGRQLLSTFTVTNTEASGTNSLAWAFTQADSATTGPSVINFNIPGTGPYTIDLSTPLPAITAPVTIDGTSQPGYAGTPLVVLDGLQSTDGSGLSVSATNVTIKGLTVENFGGDGIFAGPSASQLTLTDDNVVDNDASGVQLDDDSLVTISGDRIGGNTDGVTAYGVTELEIGGQTTADGNVITQNDYAGVFAFDSPGAVIEGNAIGTNASGQAPQGNGGPGIELSETSNAVVSANVISDNITGVDIVASTDVAVQGNLIGSTMAESPEGDLLGNLIGIEIEEGSTGAAIGGTTLAEANVITGNLAAGIKISGTGTEGNLVGGNFIGTDRANMTAVPNGIGLVISQGASYNVIGSTVAYNVISGNHSSGVQITGSGTVGNVVAGNWIGTAAGGEAVLPNGGPGVEINGGASGNMVGGPWFGLRDVNVISGNQGDGVSISDPGTTGNTVQFNFIGTDASGNDAIPNAGNGVNIENGASDNYVYNDLISANVGAGVLINGSGTSDNVLSGDWIGLDGTGLGALVVPGNWYSNLYGVEITNGASSNWVGSNFISGNDVGVYLASGAYWNAVDYNYIGTGVDGVTPVGNADVGVVLAGVTGNTIGYDVIVNSGIGILGFDGANQYTNSMPGDTLSFTEDGITVANEWAASLFD